MINHFSLSITELDRSRDFYDTALCTLGYQRARHVPMSTNKRSSS